LNPASNGTVLIRSGRLIIDSSGAVVDSFDIPGAALGIDIGVRESIVFRNGSLLQTNANGIAPAGGILITGGSLSMTDGSSVESLGIGARPGQIDIRVSNADILSGAGIRTSANSTGAAINLTASGNVTVTGSLSEIYTDTQSNSVGGPFAGDIVIGARSVMLSDGGTIHSGATSGPQSARNIGITASDSVSISSLAGIETVGFAANGGSVTIAAPRLVMDFGFISTTTHGVGSAGHVQVDAGSVSLSNGAQIATSSALGTPGPAASMTVNASGSLTITGVGPANGVEALTLSKSPSSGLFSTASGTGSCLGFTPCLRSCSIVPP